MGKDEAKALLERALADGFTSARITHAKGTPYYFLEGVDAYMSIGSTQEYACLRKLLGLLDDDYSK